jgi:hypothetical protein
MQYREHLLTKYRVSAAIHVFRYVRTYVYVYVCMYVEVFLYFSNLKNMSMYTVLRYFQDTLNS